MVWGAGGLGPSTQRSAQPSKQHRPLAGQSESQVSEHQVSVSIIVITLTRVPLSRAPAVAHGPGALLGALVARGRALAHVAVGPGPVSPEGALGRGVEAGGGVAVNIEPGK